MIFQEIKNLLEKRQYAKIDDAVYAELLNEMCNIVRAYKQNGEQLPQDYMELREWIYNRVSKDIIYGDGGYLNDHFCIGVIWGILRSCDVFTDVFDKEWTRYYNA